jgi:hypothetical protein
MDVINQVNGTLNQGLDVVNNNRIASTILGLFLILYASLAAPNLPSSVTVIFKNNWFRLAFMFLIAYTATKDTSLAIITAVALLVTLLTLSAQETTATVVKAVEKKINANIEKFAAVPAPSTSDYDQLQDYSLTNSDDRIYMGSGTISTPDLISTQNLLDSNLTGINQAVEERRALEAKNHVFRGQLGGDTYVVMGEHKSGSVVNTVSNSPKMNAPKMENPKSNNTIMAQPKMEKVEVKSVTESEAASDKEEDTSAPTLLDLVTGFENVGQANEILPFSGSTPHYDVEFDETNVEKSTHVHNQVENFESGAPEEPDLPSSCGTDVGTAVPGYDLGEFAQFQL